MDLIDTVTCVNSRMIEWDVVPLPSAEWRFGPAHVSWAPHRARDRSASRIRDDRGVFTPPSPQGEPGDPWSSASTRLPHRGGSTHADRLAHMFEYAVALGVARKS